MPAAIPAITLGALQSSGRGQKSIPILGSDGKPVYLYPGALEVPFNASAYQNPEASRVNLCYTPTKDFEEQIKALDAEVQKQLQKRLSEMFGTQAGAIEKQGEWYQSPLKTSSQGYVTVRTKTNLEGRHAVRCWNTRRESLEIPADWTLHQVRPKIWIRGVYIMGKEAGLILDTTDAQLEDIQRSCPF